MKRQSLKSLSNFFKIMAIIILINISIIPSSIFANPVGVDRRNDMCPVPYNITSIYLKSERIEVTFHESAKVKAYYTFKNDAINETELTILLPFKSKPSNLRIIQNNEQIEYFWTKLPRRIWIRTTLDNFDRTKYNKNLSAVSFNLLFNRNESKTILVKYNRNYYDYDNLDTIYYSFVYIVSTSKYWHHDIESAEFIFKVPKDRYDEMRSKGYQIKSDDKYIIATKKFENTTFKIDEIKFDWLRNKNFLELKGESIRFILKMVSIKCLIIIGFVFSAYNKTAKYNYRILKKKLPPAGAQPLRAGGLPNHVRLGAGEEAEGWVLRDNLS